MTVYFNFQSRMAGLHFGILHNGNKGVMFAIDKIHSEWPSASWKDFPEVLLSEITQQRKQLIKIVASSQVFCIAI